MMTDTVDLQRQTALNEKIVRAINRSKKFAKVLHVLHNTNITVEVRLNEISGEDIDWIRETTRFVYARYANELNRIEHLYAALAQKWPDADMVLSELTSDGSGTTTHFSASYPSQVNKI